MRHQRAKASAYGRGHFSGASQVLSRPFVVQPQTSTDQDSFRLRSHAAQLDTSLMKNLIQQPNLASGTQPIRIQHQPDLYIQPKKVDTLGGSWETLIYEEFWGNGYGQKATDPKAAQSRGVDIKLEFTPNEMVDSEKIGLTQSIHSLKEGKVDFIGERTQEQVIEKSRVLPEGHKYAGTSIDRAANADTGQNNPIYGAKPLEKDQNLSETEMPAQEVDTRPEAKSVGGIYNRLGKRNQGDIVSAVLSDTPQRKYTYGTPVCNSCQIFETTALALSGNQEGHYYGSVKWGWETDSKGNFSVVDFDVEEIGTPTERFVESAKQWNTGYSRARRDVNDFKSFEADDESPNIPLPSPKKDLKILLALPPKESYKSMKKAATKWVTIGSGMMPGKTYGKLQENYTKAVSEDKWGESMMILTELKSNLAAMDQKGTEYWKNLELKESCFTPFYNIVKTRHVLLTQKQQSLNRN